MDINQAYGEASAITFRGAVGFCSARASEVEGLRFILVMHESGAWSHKAHHTNDVDLCHRENEWLGRFIKDTMILELRKRGIEVGCIIVSSETSENVPTAAPNEDSMQIIDFSKLSPHELSKLYEKLHSDAMKSRKCAGCHLPLPPAAPYKYCELCLGFGFDIDDAENDNDQ